MPAYTEKQRRFMGAELARKRAGKSTQTGMTESQLRDFARKPVAKRKKKHTLRSMGVSKDSKGFY